MVKIRKDTEFMFGHWKIDGEYYKETTRMGKLVLKLVDKEEIENKIKMVKDIAEQLADHLDGEKILVEAIMKLDDRKVKLLKNATFRRFRAVTRSHHCVDMKVGNLIIPIVE